MKQLSDASDWRLEIAEYFAGFYGELPQVDAALVASSVARGQADRFSDLDLIVFWREAPGEKDRRAVIERAGGDLAGIYPYDAVWHCWADMFNLGRDSAGAVHSGLATDVTHYLSSEAEVMIQAVTIEFATDEPRHNLVRLVSAGAPLYGEAQIAAWQETISYPDELATAMVMKYGQIDYFWRWQGCLERGNNLMLLHENFARFAQRLLRTLLALNRVYFFGFGWIDALLARLELAPADFVNRYRRMWRLEPALLAAELAALIEETYDLIAVHLPAANVAWLRRIFGYERTFWVDPPPGLMDKLAVASKG